MGDAACALGVPVVSGNVSLYNETSQSPIHPTPMVGCVGVLQDVTRSARMLWKDGDAIVLLDGASPTIGASDYLEVIHDIIAGLPTEPDLEMELKVQRLLQQVIGDGLCAGVHDVSDGGLTVALAELAIASGVGASIVLNPEGGRLDAAWFGEAPSSVLLAVDRSRLGEILRIAREWGVPALELGRVGGDRLSLGDAVPIPIMDLEASSRRALSGKRDHVHI
jgi:phosphoribosylformylglycinamidine synthase